MKSNERLKTDKFINERPPISPIEFSKEGKFCEFL